MSLLGSLYQYNYQCGALDCHHIMMSYLGDGDLVSKVKEHNRTYEARFNYVTHHGICVRCRVVVS